MTAPPPTPTVPLWVHDEQWEVWHAWPTEAHMNVSGMTYTACGLEWVWTETVKTSYHVALIVGCYACRLTLEGTPPKRQRGRRFRLPSGPARIVRQYLRKADAAEASTAKSPWKPGPKVPKQRLPITVDEQAVQQELVKQQTGDLPPKPPTRSQRLAALGAITSSYTRPDGKEVERVHATKAQKARANAEEVGATGSFEVGRRLPERSCPQCGFVIVSGPIYCSTWCTREARREEWSARQERHANTLARRHFEDVLYRRPRRDRISTWTPPLHQRTDRYQYLVAEQDGVIL